MRHLLTVGFMLLTTPAMASPVCTIVESLAQIAMGQRQLGESEETVRTRFHETNFRDQTAIALVADFLVTEAYRLPEVAPDQRLRAMREFGRKHYERCLWLTQ